LAVHGLLFFGLVSFFLGISNLVPMTFASGHRSDGLQLLSLLRKEPLLERQLAMSVLIGSSSAGTRPREWPATWLPALLGVEDGTGLDCHAHILAYVYYLDGQEFERAGCHLDQALGHRQKVASVLNQQHLLCEAAYLAAVHAQDVAAAQAWLSQAEQLGAFDGNASYFTRAVVACAAEQREEASRWLRAYEANPYPEDANDQGGYLFGLDRLNALQNRVAAMGTSVVD
jgi:hypothetical protein